MKSQRWFQNKPAAHAPAVKEISKLRMPFINQVAHEYSSGS